MEDLILVNHVGVPDLQMILSYKTELQSQLDFNLVQVLADLKGSGLRTPTVARLSDMLDASIPD